MSIQIRPSLVLTPVTRQCSDLVRDALRLRAHDLDQRLSSAHGDPATLASYRREYDTLITVADRMGECVGLALQTHNPPAQPRDLADLVMQEALMLRQAIDAHDHDATASVLVTLQHLVACLQREHMSPHEQETLCPEWDWSRNGRLHWINHHERGENQ